MATSHTPYHNPIALISKIHTIFPLEIRRAIYSYFFSSPEILLSLTPFARPSLDLYPIHHSTFTDVERPWYIDPSVIPLTIIHEIVAAFYETYPAFTVANPREIASFLVTDFFRTGAKPCDAILSSFTVRGYLWPKDDDSFDISELASNFAPLLSQKWSTLGFKLTVVLHSEYCWIEVPQAYLAGRIISTLQALRPILAAAEQRGAEVKAVVKIGRYCDERALEHVDASEDEWKERVADIGRGIGFSRVLSPPRLIRRSSDEDFVI